MSNLTPAALAAFCVYLEQWLKVKVSDDSQITRALIMLFLLLDTDAQKLFHDKANEVCGESPKKPEVGTLEDFMS